MSVNQKKLELVQRILRQALEISTDSIIDVFVDFASHVNTLNVQVYMNGWNYEGEPELREYIRLEGNGCIEKLNYIDNYLSKIRKV